MAEARSGGARVAYHEMGPADAPAILFIHGWCSDRSTFRHQLPAFQTHYRCILPDLPGHGGSEAPSHAAYTVDYFADVMKELLGQLDAADAILVGHSLGGLIALEMAAAERAGYRAAVLIDPAPLIPTEKLRGSLERTTRMLREKGLEEAHRQLAERVFFRDTDPPELIEAVRTMGRKANERAALKTWDGIAAYDGRAALERCAAPLLFVNAERPQNREADVRALAPAAHWGRTIGTGHFNHMAVPRQVNAMIEDFLALEL